MICSQLALKLIETRGLAFFSYVLGFATTTGVSRGLGGIIGGLENLSV
jgi:hypothetical protein